MRNSSRPANVLECSEEKFNQGILFFSNRVERLFNRLKENLFSPGSSPFAKRLLVIPSQAIGNWIRLSLAADPATQIAGGFQTLFLRQAVEKLSSISSFPMDLLQLTFKIENALQQNMITQTDHPLWQPLIRYLKGSEKRLVSLARHLAPLFARYGVYGKAACAKWEKTPLNWQEALWQQIALEWDYPIRAFHSSREPVLDKDLTVHLFCFSHIAPLDFAFFQKVAAERPVFFYQLSPCQEFWSDLPTERGAYALDELYLDNRHPLLTNLGKVGKQMARLIEESDWQAIEDYEEPIGNTQLERLQQDLLFLQNTEDVLEDDSLQVHSATTPLREIEIIHNILLSIVEKEKIEPKDIMVMAPDITVYAPYIRSVFRDILDYQIMDMPLMAINGELEGLLLLLDLEMKRWSAPSVYSVLKHPLFREKQRWSEEDALQIHGWIRASGIRWGFNAKHRDALLAKRHCQRGIAQEGSTWEEGIGRLLESLAIGGIGLTEGKLLGEMAAALYSIQRFLADFYGSLTLPMHAWIARLKQLVENYFACSEERQVLFSRLDAFANAAPAERLYPFQTVELLLRNWISQESATVRSHSLQAVRFCSLLPMRAIPAKVICLIGMNHDAFPRRDQLQSLDLLKTCDSDYYPGRTDFDRYLFLEALLSARRKLIVTYQGRNPLDHSIQPPSILISQILPFVAKKQQVVHPARSYDPRYFDGSNSQLVNFSQKDKEMAECLTPLDKKLPSLFTLSSSAAPLPEGHVVIEVTDLVRCLSDPLKHYLKKACGVALQDEKELLAEENFSLSPLQLARSRTRLLTHSLEEAIQKEECFPFGVFGELAFKQLVKESEFLDQSLKGARGEAFDLITHQKESVLDKKGVWRMPACHISLSSKLTISITGRLNGVFSEGLLAMEKFRWRGALKIWPLFLILRASRLPEGFKAEKVIFARSGEAKERFFDDPEPFLKELVEYYFQSMHVPSPLYPDWIAAFLQNDAATLEKALSGRIYDPGLNWALREREPFDCVQMIEKWGPWAKRLYGALEDAWF